MSVAGLNSLCVCVRADVALHKGKNKIPLQVTLRSQTSPRIRKANFFYQNFFY